MSNNPPDVLIALSLADAEMLVADCEAAIGQCLAFMQETDRRKTLQKLVDLNEFKKRVLLATRSAIKER